MGSLQGAVPQNLNLSLVPAVADTRSTIIVTAEVTCAGNGQFHAFSVQRSNPLSQRSTSLAQLAKAVFKPPVLVSQPPPPFYGLFLATVAMFFCPINMKGGTFVANMLKIIGKKQICSVVSAEKIFEIFLHTSHSNDHSWHCLRPGELKNQKGP